MSLFDTATPNNGYLLELPVDDWAWNLTIYIDHYIKDLELHISSFPKKICDSLVIAAIRSFIDSHSSYKNAIDPDEMLIDYIVSQPWYIDTLDGIYELTGAIVAYLNRLVISTLIGYFAKNTCDVLELVSIDEYRYFIKNNGDYRIHEYYRLKQQYEPDDKVELFLQPPSDLDEKNRKLTKLEITHLNDLEQQIEFKMAYEQCKRSQFYGELIRNPANSNIVPAILSTIKKAYG